MDWRHSACGNHEENQRLAWRPSEVFPCEARTWDIHWAWFWSCLFPPYFSFSSCVSYIQILRTRFTITQEEGLLLDATANHLFFVPSAKRLGSTKHMKSVGPALKHENMIAFNPARHTWALWAGRGHQPSQTQTFVEDLFDQEVHIIARFGPTTSAGSHTPAPRKLSFDNHQFLVWPFSHLQRKHMEKLKTSFSLFSLDTSDHFLRPAAIQSCLPEDCWWLEGSCCHIWKFAWRVADYTESSCLLESFGWLPATCRWTSHLTLAWFRSCGWGQCLSLWWNHIRLC